MNDSEPIETTAIAVRAPMSVGQAMSVDEIVAQVNLVHKVMEKVMQEGTHFGTIPGAEIRNACCNLGRKNSR
jgi:hypothetical protein